MEDLTVRRILVALDASPCSRAVFTTAARMAAALDLELEGIFVEDDNLFQAAELAIAAEVTHLGGIRTFTRPQLELDLRCQADEVGNWATRVAADRVRSWHFRVLRGRVADRLMEAAGTGDLLSLGRFGHPICRPRRRLGSVARHIIGRHRAPYFLLNREIEENRPLILVTNGAPEEEPLLDLALRFARVYHSLLTVLVEDPERVRAVEQRLVSAEIPTTVAPAAQNLVAQIESYCRDGAGTVISRHRHSFPAELECALLVL